MSDIQKLEREAADKQERINRAVRDMDNLAYRLANIGDKAALLREALLDIQARLRGKS